MLKSSLVRDPRQEATLDPTILALRLSDKKHSPSYRPWSCPRCGSSIMQRWGKVTKPAWNPDQGKNVGYRYKCSQCNRTFRAYSDGGEEHYSNQDIRRLAVMAWAIGLSLSSVVDLFGEHGVTMSRSTIWRAGQDLLGGVPPADMPVEVTIVHPQLEPETQSRYWADVAVLMEIGRRETVKLHLATEESSAILREWVRDLAGELEIEVVPGGAEYESKR